MPVTLKNETPLDESTPEAQAWLANLQGNILRGHGRDFGVYIFFAFDSDEKTAKTTVSALANKYVTSALAQYQDTVLYRRFKIPGPTFGNLFLSATGYQRLGFKPSESFKKLEPGEKEPDEGDPKSTFVGGLRATARTDFGDPPVRDWEEGYAKPIDGMLLLADDDEGNLMRCAREALAEIGAHHTIRATEVGRALRNADGEGVEHFGFVDGRSQPLFLAGDFWINALVQRKAEIDESPIREWDPFAPLERVLVRDPFAPDGDCFGSFLVFRKLEQNVRGFKEQEERLATQLRLEGPERERAGALIMGRFRDGTPTTLSRTPGWLPAHDNDFTYAQDVHGHKCPFHAHIRKVNPRGDLARHAQEHALERERAITRRSITYGSPHPAVRAGDDAPSKGVGLLFMCFQSNIRRQFAYIQKRWCNSAGFIAPRVGLDPVIGQTAESVTPQGWSGRYGHSEREPFAFNGFITMKGGEFFFAPSIPFLKRLNRVAATSGTRAPSPEPGGRRPSGRRRSSAHASNGDKHRGDRRRTPRR